jgi:DNA-binding transcriptional regulator YiaG
MHDRIRLTQAKMPDEVQLELLAPWYTRHPSESRTLDFFDAIPKYPFSVTTTLPKAQRIEAPFTLRGKKYLAEILPAQIKDAQGQERLVFPEAREELVERALRFIAVQQIAKTKLTPDLQTGPAVVRALASWRQKFHFSQTQAAEYAQRHGFPLTASSLQMWEEGWRRPRTHTLALLRRFLEEHSSINPEP